MSWAVFRSRSSDVRRDAAIVGVMMVGGLLVSNLLDIPQWLYHFDEAYPYLVVDDITIALTIGCFGFGWYSWRRQNELVREAAAREQAFTELASRNRQIEENAREL